VRDRGLLAEFGARCRFPPSGSGWCAVSGGADSTALAVLSASVDRCAGIVHVDHGLRPESSSEVPLVASLADRLGVAFVAHRVDVALGPNLEERARHARYGVLPPDVWTGHTADDLAETVVLHLLRGTGLDGVASMARPRPGGVQRPLLGLRRADTVALCASLGLDTVDDPMNTDATFRRVRVRREVLPLLDDVAERDVAALLARHAEVTADDVLLLDELSATVDPSGRWALRDVPLPLARRAVRRWLVESGVGSGRVVDAAAVDRVLAVASGEREACEVDGGWRVNRKDGTLAVEPPARRNS
jgi:tRNA(Ile)-lysidine synthase